jgi:hypothetical protein
MIRGVWRQLLPFLPQRSRRFAGLLVIESLAAGLLEATLLVLVVAVALSIATGGEAVDLAVPLLGSLDLTPGPSLLTAAAFGLVVLASTCTRRR